MTTMSEERQDVLNLYAAAAYGHARYADLHAVLSNDEWDAFADEAGQKAFALIESLINDRLNAIESQKQKQEAA